MNGSGVFESVYLDSLTMPIPRIDGTRGKGDCDIVPMRDAKEQLQFRILDDSGNLDIFQLWRKIQAPNSRIINSYVIDLWSNTYLYSMKRELLDDDEPEPVYLIFDRILRSIKQQIDRVMMRSSNSDWDAIKNREVLIKLFPLSESLTDNASPIHTCWISHGKADKLESLNIATHFTSWLRTEVFRIDDTFEDISFAVKLKCE